MIYLTRVFACLIVVATFGLSSSAATADPATTEKVLGHHLKAFGEGDVAAIMSDYTTDSVRVMTGA